MTIPDHLWPDEIAVRGLPYGVEAGNSILHNVIIDFDKREIRFPTRIIVGASVIRSEKECAIERLPLYPEKTAGN